MSGANLQNYIGNIYLSGVDKKFVKKKVGKNKFLLSKNIAPPLIYDNSIYLYDDTGTVFKISKKGKKIWKRNIYKKIYKKMHKRLSLAIYENKIFVSDNIGFIYALNIDNGKLLWIKNHGIPFKSRLKIFNDKIFVINQDNKLICLDTKKGAKIWDVRSIPSFIKSQYLLSIAISKEGDLVMLNSSGDLIKLRTKDGRMHWTLSATGPAVSSTSDFFKSSDVVIADEEIILSTSSSILSFDLRSGFLNWAQNIGSRSAPIVDGEHVFLVSEEGYFVSINRKTGKIIWSTNILKVLKKSWKLFLEKKHKTQVTGFIMGSGKIYATTFNGYLIVCSATSGEVEYYKRISIANTSRPIISNNSLFVLTKKSKIIGFN